jgi:hypothetical protein
MATSWERLTNQTLGSSSATFNTTTFTAKEHLLVHVYGNQSSGNSDVRINFNSDTGSNYSRRYSTNGTSDGTSASATTIGNMAGGEGNRDPFFSSFRIINKLDKEKMIIGELIFLESGNGAGNPPSRRDWVGKWTNTSSQITSIQIDGGTFDAGSTITVWGADDQPSTPVYPNLTNGTLFEESDTGKHYMFDGSTTWNEVT